MYIGPSASRLAYMTTLSMIWPVPLKGDFFLKSGQAEAQAVKLLLFCRSKAEPQHQALANWIISNTFLWEQYIKPMVDITKITLEKMRCVT